MSQQCTCLAETMYLSAVEPSSDTRFVKFVVYDNTSLGLRARGPSSAELSIQLTDSAPVVQLNRTSVMYTEGDGSVQLSPDLTISDVDSSHAATSSCCTI